MMNLLRGRGAVAAQQAKGRVGTLVIAGVALMIVGILIGSSFKQQPSADTDHHRRRQPPSSSPLFGCVPHSAKALATYTDLGYPLRTPDLAIDALIRVYNSTQQRGRHSTSSRSTTSSSSMMPHAFIGIVLCQRRDPPRRLAIPGGFVEYGESIEAAAVREVLEETQIDLSLRRDTSPLHRIDRPHCEGGGQLLQQPGVSVTATSTMRQFRVFSDPKRDPRRHTVSAAFDIVVYDVHPRAGDDAKDCAVYDVDTLTALLSADRGQFAFDHASVLDAYLNEVVSCRV